mgnify:CR=1 FL=1
MPVKGEFVRTDVKPRETETGVEVDITVETRNAGDETGYIWTRVLVDGSIRISRTGRLNPGDTLTDRTSVKKTEQVMEVKFFVYHSTDGKNWTQDDYRKINVYTANISTVPADAEIWVDGGKW